MSRMNEREKLLYRVQQFGFMTDDIRLFLNTHPACEEAFCALKYFMDAEKEAKEDYEKRYGALTLEGIDGCRGYEWIEGVWPWEVEE